MRMRSVVKHTTQAVLEGALISLLVVGLMAGTTFAAKGGGSHKSGGGSGGTSTIALAPLVVDNNGNGTPNWSDVVRFNVSTTSTTQPYVDLYCYQNGVQVAGGSEGYFPGALDDGNFGLYAPSWMSGAADCTAYLDQSTSRGMQHLASTSFHVDA